MELGESQQESHFSCLRELSFSFREAQLKIGFSSMSFFRHYLMPFALCFYLNYWGQCSNLWVGFLYIFTMYVSSYIPFYTIYFLICLLIYHNICNLYIFTFAQEGKGKSWFSTFCHLLRPSLSSPRKLLQRDQTSSGLKLTVGDTESSAKVRTMILVCFLIPSFFSFALSGD